MSAQIKRSFTKYLNGYRRLLDKARAGSGHQFEGFIRHLALHLSALEQRRRQLELLHAPHYNIFRVMPVERRETVLHSPMLAHLLDPAATHGQLYLFLRAFFDMAKRERPPLIPPRQPLEADDWSVRNEVYIGDGSLDIFIECPSKKFALIIENKIDAVLGSTQLQRYDRWLREHRSGADYVRQLVFLTPTGRAPEYDRVPCIAISYQGHITRLLERTIPEIKAPHVKEVVRQYLSILIDWVEEPEL